MIPLNRIDVSPQKAAQFNSKGIACVEDLVSFFPRKYYNFLKQTKIIDLEDGAICRVSGEIVSCAAYDRVEVVLRDATGQMKITWFGGCYFASRMTPGAKFTFCGKVSFFRGWPTMVQPMLHGEGGDNLSRIYPVYSKIKGMSADYLQEKISAGLACMAINTPWSEQDAFARSCGLYDRIEAMRQMHAPVSGDDYKAARKRIVFDQIFSFYKELYTRQDSRRFARGMPMTASTETKRFIESLPFPLTEDQSKSVDIIMARTKAGEGLHALVTGDVGCGKTAVAMIAAVLAWENGCQSIIMAPTLILAKQHYEEISVKVEPFGIKVALLTGETKAKERRDVLAGLADGSIHILVGTHAVLSKELDFKALGMTIVDEEHRFGASQKELLEKFDKIGAHHLSMTATPIPRSYASAVYGTSLEIIPIETMPAGRKPIITEQYLKREKVYGKLLEEVAKGHQCYIVCPFIEDSDSEQFKDVLSVNTVFGEIQAYCMMNAPGAVVGCISGDMKKKDITHTVDQFAAGRIHILVSTTIVEVGVNVPNATAIAIMNAERFGMSALHQLRGRVGRKGDQGYCYLVSEKISDKLHAMCELQSGFKIAEMDLKLRGPGDILGEDQTGNSAIIETILKWPKMAAYIREYFSKKAA